MEERMEREAFEKWARDVHYYFERSTDRDASEIAKRAFAGGYHANASNPIPAHIVDQARKALAENDPMSDRAREALLAMVSAPAAAVGDWVMVPREPTEAMIKAGAHEMSTMHKDMDRSPPARAETAYRAMLAAAPQAAPAGLTEEEIAVLREMKTFLNSVAVQRAKVGPLATRALQLAHVFGPIVYRLTAKPEGSIVNAPDAASGVVYCPKCHALVGPGATTPGDGWQEIGTAPKESSGPLIDIWISNEDGTGVRWCDCYYDRICDEWRTSSPGGKLVWIKARHVTHWRPLPAPPATRSEP